MNDNYAIIGREDGNICDFGMTKEEAVNMLCSYLGDYEGSLSALKEDYMVVQMDISVWTEVEQAWIRAH